VGSVLITAKIKSKSVIDMLTNAVVYTDSFAKELNKNKSKITASLAEGSIDVFYDYLDGLARSHPGMLHHVYEWGQVGDPSARLFDLKYQLSQNQAVVSADFLQSDSVSETSNTPFFDKAYIMEEGIEVVINEVNAKALFFEIDGEEFFRTGPIVIANPGGSATRGSFVKAFNEFYALYFNQVYLKSIGFYKHFSSPREYSKYFKSAIKTKSAKGVGKTAALSWIQKAPGVK
jgi:hypothetical protein